jgi:hypothetical protein
VKSAYLGHTTDVEWAVKEATEGDVIVFCCSLGDYDQEKYVSEALYLFRVLDSTNVPILLVWTKRDIFRDKVSRCHNFSSVFQNYDDQGDCNSQDCALTYLQNKFQSCLVDREISNFYCMCVTDTAKSYFLYCHLVLDIQGFIMKYLIADFITN